MNLLLGEDYFIYKSGEQTFIPVPLPLVFVGYGIVAPEYDYNDYQYCSYGELELWLPAILH